MDAEHATTVPPTQPVTTTSAELAHDPSYANDALPPLPDDVAVLKAMIRELLESLKTERREREGLAQRFDLLLRKLYGPKAERFDPNQPWLIPEMAPDTTASETATDAPSTAAETAKAKRQGHGRKPLPADLPRRREEHMLPAAERLCPCCQVVCQKFGEDVSEQLDYHPASLFVRQHVRFKYACPKCHDHVTMGHVPIAIVNKGLPGPGLLAQIAASKYADHLPLHRLERILARHGIRLSRSTMCDWMAHVAGRLQPVVALMGTLVRQSKSLHTDATKMPFLDPKLPGKTLSGQMWAYVGDRDHPFDFFAFCRDHSATGIDLFLLRRYQGYLNADALNLYDHLFADGKIIELGCWAHCRRNFYDAKDSEPARAHVVLARCVQRTLTDNQSVDASRRVQRGLRHQPELPNVS